MGFIVPNRRRVTAQRYARDPSLKGVIFNYCATGNVYNKDNPFNANFRFNNEGQFLRFEIRIPVSVLSDVSSANNAKSSAKDYIEANPLQAVYYVTPTTYQITAQQINTLLGQNNIWSDAGNATTEYPADTKLYIEKLTQPTEDDMVANTNIASGKFFMIGNRLFLSTSAIASGATINPGTSGNCTEVSLADALNTINT